jgi:hypothetical protein
MEELSEVAAGEKISSHVSLRSPGAPEASVQTGGGTLLSLASTRPLIVAQAARRVLTPCPKPIVPKGTQSVGRPHS